VLGEVELANIREIEGLNQRGGPTLTIDYLIADETLTPEMAGYLLARMAQGASVLTAAGPSGTGKSTLLANILTFLRPNERIVCVDSALVIEEGLSEKGQTTGKCFLAHEIGAGHWYGYIWGGAVARYLQLCTRGHRVASCLHADRLAEVFDTLSSPPLNVPREAILRVGLICFMAAERTGFAIKRRVTAIYSSDGAEHRLIFSWERERQRYVGEYGEASVGDVELLQPAVEFIRELARSGARDIAEQREAVLQWYSQNAPG